MTRVLMTADTVGGVWTYALELSDALARHGMEVHVALMGRLMSVDQRAEIARSRVASVHESRFDLEWMPEPWRDVDRAGTWLGEVAEQVQPDLVHCNGYAHAALDWGCPSLVVAHSCVWSWWSAVRGCDPPGGEFDEYRRRVVAGLGRAGAVVAPSCFMLDELQRCYGIDHGTVIYNGRGAGWVRRVAPRPIVLGAGRLWDEAKNLWLLARAAPRAPWPVVIVGDPSPPWAAADETAIGGSGPGSRAAGRSAHLLGPLPFSQLAGWLCRASVYVSPARYEPFGLGALEAAQAGCALVLGDIPSHREIWGSAAWYVDPDDEDGLVAALTRLADDDAARHALATEARRRAADLGVEPMALRYRALYDFLLQGDRSSSPMELSR